MNIRYHVERIEAERCELTALLSSGKHSARKPKRAQILLAADCGVSGGSTVYRTKRRFVEDGLAAALSEQPRPGAERKLTGKEEALLIATACSAPPAGRARWTLELLAREMLRDPYFPLHAAQQLGVKLAWPAQYLRVAPEGTPKRQPRGD